MKYEEIVKYTKQIKAPLIESVGKTGKTDSAIQSFVEQLKMKDRKHRQLIRLQQYLLLFSSLIFITLIIESNELFDLPKNDFRTVKTGLLLLLVTYVLSFILFHLKYKKYRNTDYQKDIPTFLQETKKRYAYFTREKLIYIPIFILLDFGLYCTLSPFLPLFDLNDITLIVNLQLFLGLSFLFDFYIKFKLWKIKQETIFREAIRMLDQIKTTSS